MGMLARPPTKPTVRTLPSQDRVDGPANEQNVKRQLGACQRDDCSQFCLLSGSSAKHCLIRPLPVPIDQTRIKTLYILVEIGIDSSHLTESIRLNLSGDREAFHKGLIRSEESGANIPAGQQLHSNRHLRIKGPDCSGDNSEHQ